MANYTIRRGDSLSKIAKNNNTTVAELAKLNNIKDVNKIRAGASLKMPGMSTSSLTTNKKPTTQKKPTTTTNKVSNTNLRPNYKPSTNVTAAELALKNMQKNKPGKYTSSYQDQINGLLDKITNRKDFSYDFNADPMYQQYKDQYTQGGQMAMLDTTAQASTLSGGYGNSYAATAGNQAYQQYLGQLNNVIPELYGQALNQYNQEGTDMYNQMGLYQGLEQTEYGQHRDKVSDYYSDYQNAYNKYQDEYSKDYGSYRDKVSDYDSDRNYNYQQQQDKLSQENWLKQFAYQQSQDKQDQANWERQFALSKAKSSGSSSSKKSTSMKKTSPGPKTTKSGKVDVNKIDSNLRNEFKKLLESNGYNVAMGYMDRMVRGGYLTADQADAMCNYYGINAATNQKSTGSPLLTMDETRKLLNPFYK